MLISNSGAICEQFLVQCSLDTHTFKFILHCYFFNFHCLYCIQNHRYFILKYGKIRGVFFCIFCNIYMWTEFLMLKSLLFFPSFTKLCIFLFLIFHFVECYSDFKKCAVCLVLFSPGALYFFKSVSWNTCYNLLLVFVFFVFCFFRLLLFENERSKLHVCIHFITSVVKNDEKKECKCV